MPTIPTALPATASSSERLTLARKALVIYRTRCFWFLSPEFKVDETTLPIVIAGLRQHGDRTAFQIAAQLCL